MQLKFSDLNLIPELNQSIQKLGYDTCTKIQEAVIPHILNGKDVAGLAQTGTGKTAAFVIPLIQRILSNHFSDWKPQNFILILVPTRELAEQVHDNILKLTSETQLKSVSVYGGTGYDKQKEAFKNNVDFVVATPGRLIDLYKEHFLDLKQVRAIVFDEADRMFDMGFKDDMKYILQRTPRERQFLVFSATLNFEVLNTAYQFGAEPIEIDVSRDQAKAENVKDEIFHVGHEDKPLYLLSILKSVNPAQSIIFSNFKFNVDKIAQFLTSNGIPAMGISSLLSQAQRNRVLEQFKANNEKNILVATDVAARGLDIKGVDLVINYELPGDAESYVHRIGRTGRAGSTGQAYSLVSDRDIEALGRIEVYLKHKLTIGWIDDSSLQKEFKPFPQEISEDKQYHERNERYQNKNKRGSHPKGHRSENRNSEGSRKYSDNNSQKSSFGRKEKPKQTHSKHQSKFSQNKDFRKDKHSENDLKENSNKQHRRFDKDRAQSKKQEFKHKNSNQVKKGADPSKVSKKEQTLLQKITSFFKKKKDDK